MISGWRIKERQHQALGSSTAFNSHSCSQVAGDIMPALHVVVRPWGSAPDATAIDAVASATTAQPYAYPPATRPQPQPQRQATALQQARPVVEATNPTANSPGFQGAARGAPAPTAPAAAAAPGSAVRPAGAVAAASAAERRSAASAAAASSAANKGKAPAASSAAVPTQPLPQPLSPSVSPTLPNGQVCARTSMHIYARARKASSAWTKKFSRAVWHKR